MYKISTKACYFCGVRKPQTEMTRFVVEVEAGRSSPTASSLTILGAMSGDKRSKRALQNTIYGAGERKYFRKKTLWSCESEECAQEREALIEETSKDNRYKYMFLWGLAVTFVMIAAIILPNL